MFVLLDDTNQTKNSSNRHVSTDDIGMPDGAVGLSDDST